jgi:uncharacterized protein YndB with AHSA1/START domain
LAVIRLLPKHVNDDIRLGRESSQQRGTQQEEEMRLRMIYQLAAGTVLALAVLTLVALRVNTTGSYERTFDASSDKVWRVWNDPDSIKKWWGPKDFTAPSIRNDPRVGGTFLWSMKSPKGEMYWNTGVYKEVLPTIRLVSTMSFADAAGRPIPGSEVPVPGHWPNEILVTTEFKESGGKTKVTVTEVGIPLIIKVLSKIAWQQQFDKVASLL